jgi:HEAT repeat protein
MRYKKLQTSVRTLIVLVAACGAVAWAWRRLAEWNRVPGTVDWIRLLSSGTPKNRKIALRKVQAADPAEIDLVIPALIQAIGDADASVGLEAAFALARYLTGSAAQYRTANQDDARRAANRLLVALDREKDADVRAAAANVLSGLCRAMAGASIRSDGLLAFDPIRLDSLVAAFDAALERDPANRLPLVDAIEGLGPSPLAAPSGLLHSLDDPSSLVRLRVIQALSHFSSGVDRAILVLLKDLETTSDRFVPDYLKAAKGMHPSTAVVPTLIQSLESGDLLLREAAAILLAQIEPSPRAAAPVVIASVRDAISTGDARSKDERSVGSDFTTKKGTRPAASTQRSPPPGWVSAHLTTALAKVALPEDSVPLLIELLRRKSSSTRSAAAVGLAELGPAAHAAIPALIATMKDAIAANGYSAVGDGTATAKALGVIAPSAPGAQATSEEVIAVLSEALNVKVESIRCAAAEALGNFGPRAAGAIPRLHELLEDDFRTVKVAAGSALDQIEPQSKPTADSTP